MLFIARLSLTFTPRHAVSCLLVADDIKSDDDIIETRTESSGNDDDLFQFMKLLGINGAIGLMELTIAGIPSAQFSAPGKMKLY